LAALPRLVPVFRWQRPIPAIPVNNSSAIIPVKNFKHRNFAVNDYFHARKITPLTYFVSRIIVGKILGCLNPGGSTRPLNLVFVTISRKTAP
jgi:hypothetical protein